MRLRSYFRLMRDRQASDLYLTAKARAKLRVAGRIHSVGQEELGAQEIEMATTGLMNEYQMARFQEQQQIDFAIEDPDNGRFRFNVFRQRGMVAVSVRFIQSDVPSLPSLNLPEVMNDLALTHRGLILTVGATGAGKTTTLASMIDYRNQERADHIITIEDPIEYTYQHRRSIVNQRELVTDTPSYGLALKSALRASPNVVLIGEIRDRETMEATLELANTGHLCLSTLHTTNASQTIDRILNFFPEMMKRQVLLDLSASLRAIVSQRLVRSKEGRLLPAAEVMLNIPFISDLIREGRVNELSEAMETSREPGMQTYDQALASLYRSGKISLEEATVNADSRANLEAKINFG